MAVNEDAVRRNTRMKKFKEGLNSGAKWGLVAAGVLLAGVVAVGMMTGGWTIPILIGTNMADYWSVTGVLGKAALGTAGIVGAFSLGKGALDMVSADTDRAVKDAYAADERKQERREAIARQHAAEAGDLAQQEEYSQQQAASMGIRTPLIGVQHADKKREIRGVPV